MSAPRFVALDKTLLRSLPFHERCREFAQRIGDPRIAHQLTKPGRAWAMLEDGYVLGAGGVLELDRGRGLLWLTPSIFARPRHFALALPFAKRWIIGLIIHHQFRRIEGTAPIGFPAGCRLLEHLGFSFEGVMRKYGTDGADHHLYAWTDIA